MNMYALKFLQVAEGEEYIRYADKENIANVIQYHLNADTVLIEIIDVKTKGE